MKDDGLVLQFGIISTIVVLVPWVVAVGWSSSRILGIHVGFWRSAVAATLGWFAGVVAAAHWIDRIMIGAIGSLGALASGLLLLAGSTTNDQGVRDALRVLGFTGLSVAVALLMRTAAQTLRRLPLREE